MFIACTSNRPLGRLVAILACVVLAGLPGAGSADIPGGTPPSTAALIQLLDPCSSVAN